MININYLENYEELSKQAADIVVSELKKKTDLVLGLPTGSTPLGMYKNLIELNKSGRIDFSKVSTFNLDEYYPIKRSDKQSYYRFMFDNFFDFININPENINIPDGEALSVDSECMHYEQKINHAGGIDLMILGLGANGHVGFNEPGGFLVPFTHAAVLSEDTIKANARFFGSEDEVPKTALTMGIGSIIAKSAKILLLVSGESKTQAFKHFLYDNKVNTENPATLLYLHGNVTVLSDIKDI